MKPMSEMAAHPAPTLLRMQGRALGLVLASVAALMLAGTVSPAVLVIVALMVMLAVAPLYWARSSYRQIVLNTVVAVCGCAIAVELLYLALGACSSAGVVA